LEQRPVNIRSDTLYSVIPTSNSISPLLHADMQNSRGTYLSIPDINYCSGTCVVTPKS
jgi:hypothetical protein